MPAPKKFKMGRKRPLAIGPRLSLKNYLMKSLPAPPASINYSAPAAKALANIYMNNSLGCCVISGMAHVTGVLMGNAGTPLMFTNQQIISLYSEIGQYVPGDPSTDNGCDEQTALNYWMRTGAPIGSGHKIAGYLAVNANNPQECRTALFLFENLYFGLELPDAWTNPMPQASGFTWDVAGPPDPSQGHCIIGCAYGPKGITIDTWGMLGHLTNAAMAKYCTPANGGDTYTVISRDTINKATQKAPNGFDWTQLVADFDAIGGRIQPPPTP
jgi:hypothetical protein